MKQILQDLKTGETRIEEVPCPFLKSRAASDAESDKTISGIGKIHDIRALILILSVSMVLAYGYFTKIDLPNYELRFQLHSQIVAGDAPSPYRFRILVPFSIELLKNALDNYMSIKTSFLLSYAVYDLLSIFFLLASLFFWLRTWFNSEQGLIGVLFIAGTMPIALQNHYFQPWSYLEVGFLSVALIAIHKNRYWSLFFLVALASLNRETAIFIPLIFLIININFANLKTTNVYKTILKFCGLLVMWAACFWGVRYYQGSAPHIETIEGLLLRNITKHSLLLTFVNCGMFLGGWWIFAIMGFRNAPRFIKKVSLIAPFYLLIIIVWGVWYEVRLLMPLYPILVPLGLSFLYPKEEKLT